jgi:quercetin dioxygenase-like cupin family protein
MTRRTTYPNTIDNGAGELLTFVRRVDAPSGDYLEVENVVEPGSGPPMHVHYAQEEAVTVKQGRIGYQSAGEPERFAGAGETVVFEAGDVHRFWNAGDEDLHCSFKLTPPGNYEYFLTGIYESQRENGGTRPNAFDAAFLTRRFRDEFAMTEIPAPVQRVVFPLVVAVGRLLGKYRKYADAPS